jgi:hypothetical protein
VTERLIRICAPHFVAGLVPGVVAAPIIRYMLHWSDERIITYCHGKGWKCALVR